MKLRLTVLLIFLCAGVYAKTHVETAREFAPAVVTINVANTKGGTFNGTGFVVSHDGLIATTKHVIDGAAYMNVTFNTGVVSDEAETVSVSSEVDLALIKINAKNLPTVVLGDSDYTLPGAVITVIGSPRRLQNTVTEGIISQVRSIKKNVIWHQISAPISPSSSGSPVFNDEGEVISVAFSTYKGAENQNLNFAIPSNYLKSMMLAGGYIPPAPHAEKKAGPVISYLRECFEILSGILKDLF